MKILQVLQKLGLTDKEPEIYLELIKTSGVQPASIIAQKVGMNRTTVYKTLLKLAKMGLITKTMKHGITCFLAEEPEKSLEELLVNQQKQLDDLNQDFNEVISDIKDIQRHELLMPKMRYYEGIEGVKRVYEDTLVEGKEIYAFENVEDMSLEVQDYLWNSYVPRRTEKGIFAHVITPKNPSNIEFKNNDKKSARKTKFIPKAKFPIEIEINIYGEKTALFSYKHEEMFGVILESKAITNSMKAIFNLCW
ncbi:hypothetical protein KKF04_05295, partial [Patescibacteria group bacterium]|nr:hypothetical protein [Patescibacteria group bacterium]